MIIFESVYSKIIETINTLIKSPKESHFKQEITKYTLFEFNALTTQNKPQTYLIPLKKRQFETFLSIICLLKYPKCLLVLYN